MADIHPTALLQGEIDLGDDVTIGPHCVLNGPIRLGAGTRLIGNVYLQGPLETGTGNTVYPFASIGFAPQLSDSDHDREGPGTRIGDDNMFREGITVHRAMAEDEPTRIGSHNYLMVNSHVGHDTSVADHCVLVNGVLLAGHVRLDEGVVIGGNGAVHQHVRVGRGAMISGLVGPALDVPPWFMVTGINYASTVNAVGLRRSDMSREEIADVKWVYRVLSTRRLTRPEMLSALAERGERPIVREYLDFIETSARGICRTTLDDRRK